MKKVMFDMDGVLADFIYGFTSLGRRFFGSPAYSVNAHTQWDRFTGLTKENLKFLWEEIRESKYFWEGLAQCTSNGALLTINDLIETGMADIYFVTNRSAGKNTKQQTERWLQSRGIEHPTVIVTARKGETAKALGIDFSIDDKAENADCIAWFTDGKTQSYIIDRPYNAGRFAPHSSKVGRVNTVEEFLQTAGLTRRAATQCRATQELNWYKPFIEELLQLLKVGLRAGPK